MQNGNPNARNVSSASAYQGVDYTCLVKNDTRFTNRSATFPDHMCPEGMLTTLCSRRAETACTSKRPTTTATCRGRPTVPTALRAPLVRPRTRSRSRR
jgi:hypothetical protein